jgi:hypothetical protein
MPTTTLGMPLWKPSQKVITKPQEDESHAMKINHSEYTISELLDMFEPGHSRSYLHMRR